MEVSKGKADAAKPWYFEITGSQGKDECITRSEGHFDHFLSTIGICVFVYHHHALRLREYRGEGTASDALAVPREGRQGRAPGATSWAVWEPGLCLGCAGPAGTPGDRLGGESGLALRG